jgi:uncharacterized protein DUF6285
MTDERSPRANWPHDVPDARELVEAVRDYLADDLGPRAEGRDRFMLRVAANALSIAAREIEAQPADAAAHRERLAALGVDSELALSQAIRDGAFDGRRGELAAALWQTTVAKLAVANPRYRDESLEG